MIKPQQEYEYMASLQALRNDALRRAADNQLFLLPGIG